MNSKYKDCPEVISTLREINSVGDDRPMGSCVTGIQVRVEGRNKPAQVQFDIRSFKKCNSLVVEIELTELVAALSLATLNADKNKDS